MTTRPALPLCLLCSLTVAGAAEIDLGGQHYGRDAVVISNDRLELKVLRLGGSLVEILLKADAERLNPLWDAFRGDQEAGRAVRDSGGTGHFVCVDGFGPVSTHEAAAGAQGHGEAHRLYWSLVEADSGDREARLVQTVSLPRVHEVLTRTVTLRQGEDVVRVRSTLESLLGFDRPINWAEHATIGSPFLEAGATVVDLSPNRALTRPRPEGAAGRKYRFDPGREFEWPTAPLKGGGTVDIRAAPKTPDSLDHTGHFMTPSGDLAWVTALHPGKRLLLGYVFKTSQFPWLQIWEHYPPQGMMARGLEFGTQAFDRPRREMITQNRLFGKLLYRWLPARATIEAEYLMFWTRTPEGFQGVDSLVVEPGRIVLGDKRSGRTHELAFSGTF